MHVTSASLPSNDVIITPAGIQRVEFSNGKQETRLAHAQHRNMSNYIGNKFGQQDVDKLV